MTQDSNLVYYLRPPHNEITKKIMKNLRKKKEFSFYKQGN